MRFGLKEVGPGTKPANQLHTRYGSRASSFTGFSTANLLWIYSQLKRCSSPEVASMIEGSHPALHGPGGTKAIPTAMAMPSRLTQRYQVVKYASALKLVSPTPKDILRRFRRSTLQHPVDKALAELGRSHQGHLLCRYLHSLELRREIHEVCTSLKLEQSLQLHFFCEGGGMASGRIDNQETGILVAIRFALTLPRERYEHGVSLAPAEAEHSR